MDFHSLSRKELQILCKKNKIPANMTNVAMADSLANLTNVEGINEIGNSQSGLQTPQNCRGSSRRPVRDPIVSENLLNSSITLTRTCAGTRRKSNSEEVKENNDLNSRVLNEDPSGADIVETPATRTGRRRAIAGSSVRRKMESCSKGGRAEEKDGKEKENPVVPVYSTRRSARLMPEKIASEAIKISALSEEESDDKNKMEEDKDATVEVPECAPVVVYTMVSGSTPAFVTDHSDKEEFSKAKTEKSSVEVQVTHKDLVSEDVTEVLVGIQDLCLDISSTVDNSSLESDEPAVENALAEVLVGIKDLALDSEDALVSEDTPDTEGSVNVLADSENVAVENTNFKSEGTSDNEEALSFDNEMSVTGAEICILETEADSSIEAKLDSPKVEFDANELIGGTHMGNFFSSTATDCIINKVPASPKVTASASKYLFNQSKMTPKSSNKKETPISKLEDKENKNSGCMSSRIKSRLDGVVAPEEKDKATPISKMDMSVLEDNKENNIRNLVVLAEEKEKKPHGRYEEITEKKTLVNASLRQLKKMVKDKLVVGMEQKHLEKTTRPALQTLSDNCLVEDGEN